MILYINHPHWSHSGAGPPSQPGCLHHYHVTVVTSLHQSAPFPPVTLLLHLPCGALYCPLGLTTLPPGL